MKTPRALRRGVFLRAAEEKKGIKGERTGKGKGKEGLKKG